MGEVKRSTHYPSIQAILTSIWPLLFSLSNLASKGERVEIVLTREPTFTLYVLGVDFFAFLFFDGDFFAFDCFEFFFLDGNFCCFGCFEFFFFDGDFSGFGCFAADPGEHIVRVSIPVGIPCE